METDKQSIARIESYQMNSCTNPIFSRSVGEWAVNIKVLSVRYPGDKQAVVTLAPSATVSTLGYGKGVLSINFVTGRKR